MSEDSYIASWNKKLFSRRNHCSFQSHRVNRSFEVKVFLWTVVVCLSCGWLTTFRRNISPPCSGIWRRILSFLWYVHNHLHDCARCHKRDCYNPQFDRHGMLNVIEDFLLCRYNQRTDYLQLLTVVLVWNLVICPIGGTQMAGVWEQSSVDTRHRKQEGGRSWWMENTEIKEHYKLHSVANITRIIKVGQIDGTCSTDGEIKHAYRILSHTSWKRRRGRVEDGRILIR